MHIAVNLRNVIRSLLTELHVDCEPLIATNRLLLTELAAKVRRTVLFVEKETQGVQSSVRSDLKRKRSESTIIIGLSAICIDIYFC